MLLQSTALTAIGLLSSLAPSAAADLSQPTAPNVFATPTLVAPAVSVPNLKFETFGGWGGANNGGGGGLYGVAGALSMPIGQQYGLQIDALLGSWAGHTFYGTAGHLFWRDPSVGLAGIYGSFKHVDTPGGSNLGQIAFEGEYYMPTTTVRGKIGWEGLDLPSRVFAKADLDWYATPDLALSVGYRYTGGESALALGAEWLTPHNVGGHRLAVFGEGRVGQNNHNSILAGVRLYTGPAQTLKDKHRQDDPEIDKDLYAFADLLNPTTPTVTPSCDSEYTYVPGEGCVLTSSLQQG
jgi:hypothetical protein